jgi:hypothetical protein
VIRHQINIGAKLPWSEAAPGLHEESTHLQIFSVRSRASAGSLRPTLGSGVSGKGSFGGEGAEVKEFTIVGTTIEPGRRREMGQYPDFRSYLSASGCRSRTRLFKRSSTTWV